SAGTTVCNGSTGSSGSGTSESPCFVAEATLARIHVAQQKDLLIGVSGQIGLITMTQAKGKGGANAQPVMGSATAEGSVKVTLDIINAATNERQQIAAPGQVVFASRMQELEVTVDSNDPDYWTEVTVNLILDTTAAHHFNFIGVDLPQGDYDVKATFDLSSFVEIVGEDAAARAKVTLGPRMVTVQEVRAAKGSLTPLDPN
ncbi:MAG: hypothetical protein VW339_12020, partial [Quisquiliibacterium sp.]